jgi:hypothetical protein
MQMKMSVIIYVLKEYLIMNFWYYYQLLLIGKQWGNWCNNKLENEREDYWIIE